MLRNKISFKSMYVSILLKVSALIYLTFIIITNLTTPTTAYFLDENIYNDTLPTVNITEEAEGIVEKEEEVIEKEGSNKIEEEKDNSLDNDSDTENQDDSEEKLNGENDKEHKEDKEDKGDKGDKEDRENKESIDNSKTNKEDSPVDKQDDTETSEK